MTPRKPKLDATLTIAKDADEAMNYIFIGIKYFLVRHPLKTVVVLALMLIGPAYVAIDYFSTTRVTTKVAKPMSEQVTVEDVPIVLVSQQKRERVPIILNGQKWGYSDPSYVSFVSEDGKSILVYRKGWSAPIWIEDVKLTAPITKK